MKQEYDVRRKSDGLVVHGPVFVHSPNQAVGYYVARVLKKRYEQHKFYATIRTLEEQSVVKLAAFQGSCPKCGYVDPLGRQASRCPNCEFAALPR
ncbi:MAG: hypothetical protein Q7K65_04610 [Candidatus Buchananbacteria bacterium]|nr:hypothetical protein [Candidatus Buchananbacteria bacterium]